MLNPIDFPNVETLELHIALVQAAIKKLESPRLLAWMLCPACNMGLEHLHGPLAPTDWAAEGDLR